MLVKTLRSILAPVALVCALGSFGPLLPGCGGASGVTVCEQWCGCAGCTQTERGECEASFSKGEALSADKGCTEGYDRFVFCLDKHLTCIDDKVEISACKPEEDAMKACIGAAD